MPKPSIVMPKDLFHELIQLTELTMHIDRPSNSEGLLATYSELLSVRSPHLVSYVTTKEGQALVAAFESLGNKEYALILSDGIKWLTSLYKWHPSNGFKYLGQHEQIKGGT